MNKRIRERCALVALATIAAAACSLSTEPAIPEDNIGFVLRSNLPCVNAEVNGQDATLVVASALPRSTVSSALKGDLASTRLLLGSTFFTRVKPAALDVAELPADGMLGADALRGRIATFDYFRGLLILSAWPRPQPEITPWRFEGGPPRVPVTINGRETWAIVDTALPDTAVIPGELIGSPSASRAPVDLFVSGVRFDNLDVSVTPVTAPRLGNRVLARFVVTIDYARQRIGLWPDPRTAGASPR